jgi:hypothetical protein
VRVVIHPSEKPLRDFFSETSLLRSEVSDQQMLLRPLLLLSFGALVVLPAICRLILSDEKTFQLAWPYRLDFRNCKRCARLADPTTSKPAKSIGTINDRLFRTQGRPIDHCRLLRADTVMVFRELR